MDQAVLNKALKAYAGRKVLITGDTGFKGSWLCLALKHFGAEVMGLSLPPLHDEDHYNVAEISKVVDHRDCDVRDLDAVMSAFSQFQPEVVFHLAAQALVRPSYRDPKTTLDTNFGGTVNLMEACRLTDSVQAVVTITSDKCYRNKGWIWGYRENDELGGEDPYSASKAAAEMVFYTYLSSYFSKDRVIGAASTRAGNVIGGGDWAEDRIVPDCMRAFGLGNPVELRNPAATRPWQHVLEPVGGYMLLGAKLLDDPARYSGSWNFGPKQGVARSVGELAELAAEQWDGAKVVSVSEENAPYEAPLLQLNCDKATHELGWGPLWDFEQTVEKTVSWYRKVHEGIPAEEVTRAQLLEYFGENND